jgi:hypothetical protein
VRIAELDFVRSAGDDLAQFLTLKQHVAWDSSSVALPMTPGRGEKSEWRFLIGLCSFLRETSSLGLVLDPACTQKLWIYRWLQASASS